MANVGGMQRVAVELSEALDAHPDTDLDELALRSSWRWLHVKGIPWLVKAFRTILRKARRGHIDAVLFSSLVPASLATLLKPTLSSLGIPMAAIAHGRDVTQPGPYQLLIVRRILGALDAVLPVSRATAAECVARGVPRERIHIIPNGVNTARFPGEDSGQRLAKDKGVLLLCSVGRLVKRKGIAWFVREVMPLLPDRVRFRIAGAGPQAEAIAACIRRHQLQDRVQLLGQLSDAELLRLYGEADLLVMPNIPVSGDMEGFGVVMLEAGACGIPVIAARLEGIQDVIMDGINGHLVESGEAPSFVEAIRAYLQDGDELHNARQRARAHTLAAFRWDKIAGRYVSRLQTLIP